MNQQNTGYSAVYSQNGACPSCGITPWQPATQQMPSAPAQSGSGSQPFVLPAQPAPSAAQSTAAPGTSYQQLTFPQSSAATQTGGITSGSFPGTGTFVPNVPPESFSGAITDLNQPMPMTVESLQYLNGFLRTQIGRRVRVEFLLGTNTLTDRTGTLLGVGANYILINESDSDDLLACDFYNIKFIRFYY